MNERALALAVKAARTEASASAAELHAPERLERLVADHYRSVWRFVRRLGIGESDVDDVLQEVMMVVARRLNDIELDRERAFMMATAYRVTSDFRRTRSRRAEVDAADSELVDPLPAADALLDQRRARALLDAVLNDMPLELRAVFVLYELEGMTMAEISTALELAAGTVASRLRRARESFEARVAKLERRAQRSREHD